MGCFIQNGIARDCNLAAPGIDKLVLMDYSTLTPLYGDAEGLTMVGLVMAYGQIGFNMEYDQNYGNEKAKFTQGFQNGDSQYVKQSVEGLHFSSYTAVKGKILKDLIKSRSMAIINQRGGDAYIVAGTTSGLRMESGGADTGAQQTDFTGIMAQLSGNERVFAPNMSLPVAGATLADLYIWDGQKFAPAAAKFPSLTVTAGEFVLSQDGGSTTTTGLITVEKAIAAILGISSYAPITASITGMPTPTSVTAGSSNTAPAVIVRGGNVLPIDVKFPTVGVPTGMTFSS